MRIEMINENEYIIYVIKEYMEYNGKSEEFLEKIFEKVNEIYGIDNTGYVSIVMYKDPKYGVILECLTTGNKYYSYKLNIELEEIDTQIMIETSEPMIDSKIIDGKQYIIPKNIKDYELGEICYNIV